jgi:hypothetical protein
VLFDDAVNIARAARETSTHINPVRQNESPFAVGASRVLGMSALTSRRPIAPTRPRNKNTTVAHSNADHALREIEMSSVAL